MMNEDLQKFGRSRLERSDFSLNNIGMMNPASRQIYLTFPADSTFREEDVSNYFRFLINYNELNYIRMFILTMSLLKLALVLGN